MHVEERHPAERADLGSGDLMITVAGEPMVDAQTPPGRMFGEAFDVPLPSRRYATAPWSTSSHSRLNCVTTPTADVRGSP